MTKKNLFKLLGVFALILASCATPAPTVASTEIQGNGINVSSNWDYIAFSNMSGYPNTDDNAKIIGNAIYNWEQDHPDRRIVSLQIIQQQRAYTTSAEVLGLSIYSEVKP